MARKSKARKHKSKLPKKPKQTMAARADRHDLYQRSVQSPEADCELFAKIYTDLRGHEPTVLREDFCGTALLSSHWCRANKRHRAIGVDLDGPTLAWGRKHNVEPHAAKIGDRLELVQANVLEVEGLRSADITAALNFSFCIFKQRATLRRYFECAHAGLAEDGILILEMFGGTKAIDTDEEIRDLDTHLYHWEQESFNPITNEILCHIHFEFADESRIEKAFTYDWRLWSLPELRELLEEVGFRTVRVFWEIVEEDDDEDEDDEDEDDDDEDDEDDEDDDEERMLEGTGEYEEVHEVEQQDSWLVYIVAER